MAAGDLYFQDVSLLLHCDGANLATQVVDASNTPKTVSVFGNAKISTAQSQFGGSSLSLDGLNSYVSVPQGTDFTFGSGDFTIEAWVYPTALDGVQEAIFGVCNSAGNTVLALVINDSTGKLVPTVYNGTTFYGVASTASVPLNASTHVALCRSGNTLYLSVGGQVTSSPVSGSVAAMNSAFTIGRFGDYTGDNRYFTGYIDEVRVTKGVARYTANFTPSTSAFPNVSVLAPTTWNPSDKGASVTLTNNNLTATEFSKASVRSVYGAASGKWYWEMTWVSGPGVMWGIGTSLAVIDAATSGFPGADANGYSLYSADGSKYNNNINTPYNGAALTVGATVGIKLDLDALTLSFVVGGVDKGVAFNLPAGKTWFAMPGASSNGATSQITANFGRTPFVNALPAGFNPGLGTPTTSISGNVKDSTGANAARTVLFLREDTGALQGSVVSAAADGNFSYIPSYAGSHIVIVEPATGEALNALVFRGVVPQ